MATALITGASQGFGAALARALAGDGWGLIIDARGEERLREVETEMSSMTRVRAISGDVSVRAHREQLLAAVEELGGLDLLVNNASRLGPSPQPRLADYSLAELKSVFEVNLLAPVALSQLVLPHLRSSSGTIVNVSSDAAVEAYEGWGGYGASKAALDHASAILAAEEPQIKVYAFDPGDMRTQMHQDAFPGEDISDRPEPETVVPSLLRLLKEAPPSGRYRGADFSAEAVPA